MSIEKKQATQHIDLIARLLNPCIPKTELEHAAAKEIEALRTAIEQAEKPWVKTYAGGKPNYTTPQKREWVGLTYQERCEIWNISSKFSPDSVIMHDFAKDIEQALKEKNT